MEADHCGKSDGCGQRAVGKRTLEWDLNDWNWDGDQLRASPKNSAPSGCRREQDFSVLLDDEELNDEAGPLSFQLGEQVYPIVGVEVDNSEGKGGKKGKGVGASQSACQVEGCTADLSKAKDYHRRHKVCEVHSKATEALVGNVLQRFCQQCSKFHAREEFDEGRRSCRRRLDGHNKRRRKQNLETLAKAGSFTDEKSAGQLLITLLKALSNVQYGCNQSSELSQTLEKLADLSSNNFRLQQGSQGSPCVETSNVVADKDPLRIQEPSISAPSTDAQRGLVTRENQGDIDKTECGSQLRVLHPIADKILTKGSLQEASVDRPILGGFDLNKVYDADAQDCQGLETDNGLVTHTYCTEWMLPSPPQASGNSPSTSGRSSSSGSEAQYRTDQIVFKLFGKDPNDMPDTLRPQILEWLSQSPIDIEGYIRPGCIVLTLYLRLKKTLWEEFCYNMKPSLRRLLEVSSDPSDPFWHRGWIFTRIQQYAVFICDGQVLPASPLPSNSWRSHIASISPIAVPVGESVELVVRGSNLTGRTSRLFCAIEGKYVVQESFSTSVEGIDIAAEPDMVQSLRFQCSIPNVVGRGFIEVEVEDCGPTGCYFPFIVAAPEVCSEICTLERVFEVEREFIHEMGWLLHMYRLSQTEPRLKLFPFERLKWLVEFSFEHCWCAVLRELLDFLFSGIVDTGCHASTQRALSDMTLLHRAVKNKNKLMVEFFLNYVPKHVENTSIPQQMPDYGTLSNMVFKPDVSGAGGLTPLHIAASSKGFDDVLDALLEDPGMVGIEAWKNARDSARATPYEYACSRGYVHYIQIAQRKIDSKSSREHAVLDIPSLCNSLYTEKVQISQNCKLCEQRPDSSFGGPTLRFRPAVLALVAVAVVCVCTALLFKSGPAVNGLLTPFRWEAIGSGSM